MTELKVLRQRIEARPANELRAAIVELGKALPAEIGFVERIEDRAVLGKCLLEVLVLNDPLLGDREYYLRVFRCVGTQDSLMHDEPVQKFEEITDENGLPLFDPADAKRAVLEVIDALIVQGQKSGHPYKLYFDEFIRGNPSVKHPEAAAAAAYWKLEIDKDEKSKRSQDKTPKEALESFRRHFKRELKQAAK